MPRRTLQRRHWLLGAIGWAGWGHAVAGTDDTRPLPEIGAPLPLADVPLLEGGRFRAIDADRRVLVLYYWASWCPFCAEQSPWMEKLWQAHRGRGLTVLGLSIDKTAEPALRYRARQHITFPSGLLTREMARVLPKPRGLPVTVVRGRDGRVAAAESGPLFPEDVDQLSRFL